MNPLQLRYGTPSTGLEIEDPFRIIIKLFLRLEGHDYPFWVTVDYFHTILVLNTERQIQGLIVSDNTYAWARPDRDLNLVTWETAPEKTTSSMIKYFTSQEKVKLTSFSILHKATSFNGLLNALFRTAELNDTENRHEMRPLISFHVLLT